MLEEDILFSLFLKVQVILKLWYNFEEEKGRYKNVHTIAPVIIKKKLLRNMMTFY